MVSALGSVRVRDRVCAPGYKQVSGWCGDATQHGPPLHQTPHDGFTHNTQSLNVFPHSRCEIEGHTVHPARTQQWVYVSTGDHAAPTTRSNKTPR